MIYFILSPANSVVKIGYSIQPKRRFARLLAACPVDLVYLGDVPGNGEMERKLHTHFFSSHVRNEWFRYEGGLVDDVAALIAAATTATILSFAPPQGESALAGPLSGQRAVIRAGVA